MVSRLLFCVGVLLGLSAPPSHAQYILPYDTLKRPPDTSEVGKDTTVVTDTVEVSPEEAPLDTNYVKPRPSKTPAEPHAADISNATLWVRRMLFRGWLDTSHIGAYARYQLTSWSPGIGSYGPVEARVTIYYLGPTTWLGKDAEWLQAAAETMGDEPLLIEYDLIVPPKPKIDGVYRVLYRVDRGDVKTGNFGLPENMLDYDRLDEPQEEGLEDLEFYSGIYQTQVYHGSGTDGSVVYIFRADKMPPLGIVVLGYGDEGLTFQSAGSDASPRFYVPPPPGR